MSKDTCYTDLKRRILVTDLAPGADLDESSLSTAYGISRTPLREVLQRLAGGGYVRLAANRGAQVASLDVATLRIFFQTAPMIYANIARLAAEHRSLAQLEDLRTAQTTFTAATASKISTDAALANHTFHAVIGQMAHNPYLMACLDRLLIDHTRLGQTFYRPTDPQDQTRITQAADQHDGMIDAIADRDADRAVALTLAHWDLSRDRMERFVRPDPLPIDLTAETEHAL